MRISDLPPHLQARARAQLGREPKPRRNETRNIRPPVRPTALPDPADGAPQDWPPLVLVVPMPPTLTNSDRGRSRHWRAVQRERKAYLEALDALLVTGRIQLPPLYPLRRVWLRSSMVLHGAMDDDGAVARHKWPIDWLVSTRYLVSDRRTCLRWAAFPDQRITRAEPAQITLTISPRTED